MRTGRRTRFAALVVGVALALVGVSANATTPGPNPTSGPTDGGSQVTLPKPEANLEFVQVSAGGHHSLAIATDGKTYAWGLNSSGQLGNGASGSGAHSSVPVVVGGEVQVTGVLFGEVPATDLIDNGDGSVTVTSPAHVAGAVDVSVEWTLGGVAQDPVVYPDAFTFEDPVAPEVVVERFAGSSRYGTNLALLEATFVAGDPLFGATGLDFPDALSAAVPAGKTDQRLVLAQKTCIPGPVVPDWIKGSGSTVTNVTLVGGTGVLTDGVQKLAPCEG